MPQSHIHKPHPAVGAPGAWLVAALALLLHFPATAQERWFQIEVSVFSNESLADRAEEMWLPERQELVFPARMQRLQTLFDLLFVDSLLPEIDVADLLTAEPSPEQLLAEQIAAVGPPPQTSGTGFRFIDFARDSFLQLPNTESDFQQTNRALERSADHRLLFHGLWRQPVENTPGATPIYVSGGQNYGEQPELQGSITIRFNDNRDRVVIDADLWLTEFSTLPLENVEWRLPDVPAGFRSALSSIDDGTNNETWHPVQVYHMQQSREMRSNEFHYVDHPALGLVITVFPYEVPPLIQPDPAF